jgi:hypothetical protein
MTYEQLPSGEMKVTADGQSYTFKADGKDGMTPWGMTQAWKAVNATTWQVIEKTKDKVTATSNVTLSADGKALTIDSKRVKSDGGTTNESVTFQRVAGGPGLAGKWKTSKLTSSSPETLSLTPKGSDGLTIMLGNEGAVCDAKFDGKDYPATGSMWPAGWSCKVTRQGASAIQLTWKKDGKDMYTSTLTASASGRVLTESGSAAGVNEKFTVIYDKQ